MLWDFLEETYLGDEVEHDVKEESSAVSFLSCLGLVLEEGELAFDAVPEGHLIDVVEEDEAVEHEHEVLHPVDRWQEHLLQVLRRLRGLREDDVLGLVVELEWEDEGTDANDKDDGVLDWLEPDQLNHYFWFLICITILL